MMLASTAVLFWQMFGFEIVGIVRIATADSKASSVAYDHGD